MRATLSLYKIISFASVLAACYSLSAQNPATNPNLQPACPMNILFIMDESGSIAGFGNGTSNVSQQVRAAATSALNALNGTGSRVAIVEFNTRARRAVVGGSTSYQEVNAATINNFLNYVSDNNTAAEDSHYDPEDYLTNTQNAFTNWEEAFMKAQSINTSEGVAQLILFFTDGFPTAYITPTGGVTTGSSAAIKAQALAEATGAANAVKAQGSHIFVVGLPNPILPESNVQQISGMNRYPDLQSDFTKGDYSISSPQTLQADLTSIGRLVCRADLRLSKTVSSQISCPNGQVVFTITVTNDGLLNTTDVQVKDYLPNGYNYVSNDGGAAFSAGTLTWNVGTLNNAQSKSLQITATVKATGSYNNVAEVTASSQPDGDSSPGNNNSNEDDQASAGVASLLNCDDGDVCTQDACSNGVCTHSEGSACCITDADCNDNDACTLNDCNNGQCTFTPSSSACDDNDVCTNDVCSNGNCIHILNTCSDNNSCTLDECSNGNCTHTTIVCQDDNPCTTDLCAGGFCRFIVKNCNDGNPCTTDACTDGNCTNTSLDCDDENPCTADNCANNTCSNVPLNCDDGSANTIDVCVAGECVHTFVSCENPAPLHILFILDESGSISGFGTGTGNVSSQVRNGVTAMFNSLVETNTRIAVVEFNTTARRAVISGTTGFQQITTSTLPAFLDYAIDNNFTADNDHYDPEDYGSNQSGTFTNWDGALQLAQAINNSEGVAPLVIFFTDGKPTAYNNASGGVTTGSSPALESQALAEAVAAANLVKAQGTHIFVVGIPNPSLPESNVQAISGPKRYPDIEPVFTNADYSISNSQSLQNDLGKIGGLLCRADLSLKKSVSQPVACAGDVIVFTITITNNGLENATGVQVKDYLPSGFTYVSNNGGASYSGGVITWDIGNLSNGQSKTLQITATVNASGDYKNVAEITASDQEDSDSHPNNYNGNNPAEDDEAATTVVMNCNCYLRVTSLTMMHEGLFGEIGELTDGKEVNRDTLCRWNVRANLCQSSAGSVKFLINGTVFRTENTAPYALNGDQPSGSFTPWIPNPGNYTLTVVAYSGSSGSGTAGPSYTVRFTVLPGETNTMCLAPPTVDCTGKVNGRAFKDECGICSGGTSGHAANSDKDRCGICFGDGTSCCITNDECNDNNLCTFDFCDNLDCEFISSVAGDGNACTVDGCNPETGEFFAAPVNCDDGNDCTQDDCNTQTGCTHLSSEGCCVSDNDCNDNDACTLNQCVNNQCSFAPDNCDDKIDCTVDNCDNQTGCQHIPAGDCCISAADCNDDDACTENACTDNQCSFSNISCDDNNNCTVDNCDIQIGCAHDLKHDCCNSDAECSDGDPCTEDACASGSCSNTELSNLPPYLKMVNPSASYRKMRLGYGTTGLFSPKFNVIADGNNQVCITLKEANGTVQWNKIKVKPQGAGSPAVYLGTYVTANPGTGYFTVCIPLSVFTSNNFTQLSYLEFQCNNATAFEIHIQKIEFIGGNTPFLWFGDPKTDNFHDGTSGSTGELITTLVPGLPCGAPKLVPADYHHTDTGRPDEIMLSAYPNPFDENALITFSLQSSERAKVEIVGVDGRLITRLFDGVVNANAMNEVEFHSGSISNGIYFCRLITETGAAHNRKLVLLR